MKLTLRTLPIHIALLCVALACQSPDSAAQEQDEAESPSAPDSALAPEPGDEGALKIWSAEVLGSEGQFEKAASEYLGAALLSDDPEIAERATEVAIDAKSWAVAAMAGCFWTRKTLRPGKPQLARF